MQTEYRYSRLSLAQAGLWLTYGNRYNTCPQTTECCKMDDNEVVQLKDTFDRAQACWQISKCQRQKLSSEYPMAVRLVCFSNLRSILKCDNMLLATSCKSIHSCHIKWPHSHSGWAIISRCQLSSSSFRLRFCVFYCGQWYLLKRICKNFKLSGLL